MLYLEYIWKQSILSILTTELSMQYAMFNVWYLVTAPYLQVSVDSVLVKGVADRTNGVSSYDTSST